MTPPGADDPPAPTTASLASFAPLREGPGSHIGAYKILQQIGEGGFGVVFMAEQERPVRRRVALKIIKLGMDTRSVIARFEAERQALAMMDHANIARVLDAGSTDSGRPYFVMELVKGDPITEYADRNNLSIPERLELFEQVCRAVQHAHTKGVIHRDLKPSNILVSTQDGRPHAKVIDFGVAKATDHRLTEKTLFTEHKALIGTPEYMSPEQAEGSLDIDTRTDVYSLGVLLYELLTGSTPFESQTLRSKGYAEIQRIIREVDPPKPSTRLSQSAGTLPSVAQHRRSEPRKLGLIIRGELDWIVMKALDKDRSRRYETANALAMDVDRYIGGESVLAAPPSAGYRLRKFVRRNRALVASASVVLLALIVGASGIAWGWWNTRETNILLRQKTEAAEWEAYAANLGHTQAALAANSWPEARRSLDSCPPGLRGWEWQYLHQHTATVDAAIPVSADWVAFDASGKHVLTLNGPIAQLWDLKGRAVSTPMAFGTCSPCIAAISPDGGRVALASCDGSLSVWDSTGTMLNRHTLHAQSSFVKALAFSPDGRWLVSGSSDSTARIWTGLGEPHGAPLSHESDVGVYAACFSTDSARVMTGSSDGTVRIWDVQSAGLLGKFKTEATVYQLSLTQGGLLAVNLDTSLRSTGAVWDISDLGNPRTVWTNNGHARLSADGTRILACQSDGGSQVFELGGAPVGPAMRQLGAIQNAWFVPGHKGFLTDSFVETRFRRSDGAPTGAAMHADQFLLASTRSPLCISWTFPSITVWDDSGFPTSQIDLYALGFGANTSGIRLAPQEDRLLVPLHAETNNATLLLPFPPSDLPQITFSAIQAPLALQVIMPGFASGPTDRATRTADGAVARAGADGLVLVTRGTAPSISLSGHEGSVRAVAFSPDGSRLVSGGEDRTLRFWETTGWRPCAVFRLPRPVHALHFSPDGARLAISFDDQSARVWDIRDASEKRKDYRAQEAEWDHAALFVDNLLAGPTPTPSLRAAVLAAVDLPPLRRLVALRVLGARTEMFESRASAEFGELRANVPSRARLLQLIERRGLEARVKERVLRLADSWNPSAEDRNSYAWELAKVPGASKEDLREALHASKEAVADADGDDDVAAFLNTVGVCHYRLDEFQECLETLHRSNDLYSARKDGPQVGDWAVIAMAHHRLGQRELARAALDRVRELLASGKFEDPDSQSLAKEAQALLQSREPEPPKAPTTPTQDR